MNDHNRKRLLLADDEVKYRKSLRGYLELDGYEVTEAVNPEEAIEMLLMEHFDLVLADLRMRDKDDLNDIGGIEVAKAASARGIPCIIVTAFPDVDVARIALRARGAEPYAQDLVKKASGPQAVVDSINSILPLWYAKHAEHNPDGLVLDLMRRLAWKDGRLIKLSKDQYSLLEVLYKKDGGVCTYAELVWEVYSEKIDGKKDSNHKRLRNLVDRTKEKIEDEDSDHEYLEAVPGRGYRLNLKKKPPLK